MKNQVTPERVMQFAWGYAPTLIIEAAVRHRVFDLLDESPKTVEQLAKKSGASQRGLTAIVNALVGLGFLSRKGERYALTPESAAFLVSSKPGFLGALYKHMSSQIIPKWLELGKVVRTGKPAGFVNEQKPGEAFFV
ncbi:MAG TPA: methyltransferase dimerization domain-containing protein, partial [Candidatus Polarisedimenticolia bacterium]|nr:methyltransferase dimerization domain-containing protein [Candidatus Polarisedimenticolia bacterium]